MMRKTLGRVLIALFIVVLTASAGFAANRKTKGPINISYFLWGTKDGLSSVTQTVQRFNNSQDKIKVDVIGVDPSVYFQKLNAFLASNTAPDVIQVAADYGDAYIKKNAFTSLDSYVAKKNLRNMWPQSLVDSLTVNNKLYALPIGTQVQFITYNKDLFDKAGLPYPKNGWTEEEFLNAAKKLTIPNQKQWGVFIGKNPEDLTRDLYGQYCYDWKAKKMKAKGNQAYKDALEFMVNELFHRSKVTPITLNKKDVGGGFETGKYGMSINAVWDLEPFSKTIGNSFKWDIVACPVNSKFGQWRLPLYVQALSLNKNCKQKAAAFEFMKWMATDKMAQTSMSDSFPVCNTVLNEPQFLQEYAPGMNHYDKKVIIDTINKGITWWNTGVVAEINDKVIAPEVDKLILKPNETSVDNAINTIQKNGQELFDQN